ncbi:MAG: peptidoglycan editing factor PgeF [Gammaproteobacteria bacterium]|nr:peptidoglycan editing factor PgeF [Gammaproteobacteria bacterium]
MPDVPHITSGLLESMPNIRHGFFTRLGGTSTGAFHSLNCGQFSGDDAKAVRENRKRVARGLECRTLYSLKQVHSDRVVTVDAGSPKKGVQEGDGMVTDTPGIGLGVMGADCAGILFADHHNRVIGAAHGGWKGALDGITDNVVQAMCRLGAVKNQIVAAIGPAIQMEYYEVGLEFLDRFVERSPIECADCFEPGKTGDKRHFDLPLYLERRLQRVLPAEHIDRLVLDTYSAEQQFFSYRRTCHAGGTSYGRQVSVVSLV